MAATPRRQFLHHTLLASTAAYLSSHSASTFADDTAAAPQPEASANDMLRVAVVGVAGRGGSHIQGLAGGARTTVTHLCDCDEEIGRKRCEDVAKLQNGLKPQWVRDIRQLVEMKEIDIVTIATPNHWHSLGAIWAIQAGKDVYVEKPISHNVWEGRQVALAAEKHQRIVQTGTQCRSNPGMRAAIEHVHQGGIGRVQIARGLCYKTRGSIGPRGEYPVPASIDYDLWSGPAPMLPVTRPRFHYDWHWQWPYGNGDLGNQGIHQMDLCRWALNQSRLSDRVFSYGGRFGYVDAGETANTQVVVHDYGDQQLVFEVRGLKTEGYRDAMVGIVIEGTDGYLVMTSYDDGVVYSPKGEVVQRFSGGGDHHHYQNFVDAVLARDASKLNAGPIEGHLSSALCHLGNISLRLGQSTPVDEVANRFRDLQNPAELTSTFERTREHLLANEVDLAKTALQVGPRLTLDPAAERFVDHDEANAMLTRDYREGFQIRV